MYRRSIYYVLGTLLVYGLLVAPHEGEFWPFSIYPMFSQAGNDWSRAVVRELPEDTEAVDWTPLVVEELPGEGYALHDHGVDEIDLANFVSKTQRWTPERTAALVQLFHDQLAGRSLLVMRVDGSLEEDDTVAVEYVPYVFVRADTTMLNPTLPR